MTAKYSISITELTREANQQNPKIRPLMGDLDEEPANKKVIRVMYLSLGEATKKQLRDKYPNTALCELKEQQVIILSNDYFRETAHWIATDSFQDCNNLAKPYPNFGTP